MASDSDTGANSEPAGAAANDQAAGEVAAGEDADEDVAAGQVADGQVTAGKGAPGSTSPGTTVQVPAVGGVWILLGSAAVGVIVFILLLTILRGRVTT